MYLSNYIYFNVLSLLGLGNKTTRVSGVDDYRDAAKATLFSRFNER